MPTMTVALLAGPRTLAVASVVASGRYAHQREAALALDIAARRALALRALVTHRFSLERTWEAFETAADKKTGSVKASVLP